MDRGTNRAPKAGHPSGAENGVEFIDIVFSRIERDLKEYAERDKIEREIAAYAKKGHRRRSA